MSLPGMFFVGVVLFVIGVVIDRKNKTPDGEIGSFWRDGRLIKASSTGAIIKGTGKSLCLGAVMLFLVDLYHSSLK